MKNVKIRRKGRGFTLVELVIVIAVIAVLSAVLIPVFGNVITSAKVAALRANIVTLNSNLMLRAIKDDNRSSYSAEEINKILDDMDFDLENTPKGYSIWYDQSINNLRLLKNDSAFSPTPSGTEAGVRKAYAANDEIETGNRTVEALNPYNRNLFYIDRTDKTITDILKEVKGDVVSGVKQPGLIAKTESENPSSTSAERAAKRAAAEAKRHTADMCILLAAAAIAVLVFIVCGSIAAASRGFVFGVGGEALLGGAVVFGLFRFWKKIKKHLD